MDGKKHYPLEICRREIAHYKQIYKIAKDKNVQLISLFKLLERAFGAATLGYQLHQGSWSTRYVLSTLHQFEDDQQCIFFTH